MARVHLSRLQRFFAGFVVAFVLAAAAYAPARAQQVCDPATRLPGQWCSGDVFLGVGNIVDYPVLDRKTGLPTFDHNGDPITQSINQTPGTFLTIDGNGTLQTLRFVDAVASGLFPQEQNYYTTGCTQDPVSGDLFTTGFYSNVISRFSFGSTALKPGGSFDLGNLSRIACYADPGVDPNNPLGKCGAAESLAFDKSGNLYVGTVDGTNRLIKFNNAGAWLASYTLPLPIGFSRGIDWIDLAADQVTMYYTTESNYIVVFRTDGHPLTESMTRDPLTGQLKNLYDAGVEHLSDPVLDPGGAGNLFGRIVIKTGGGSPIGNRAYAVRLLAPGDGSGGILVAIDFDIWRVGLDGVFVRGYIPANYQGAHYFGLDITPDGKSFWTANLSQLDPVTGFLVPSQVFQFHIPTGLMAIGPKTYADDVHGVCVVNEYTAGARQPDCGADSGNELCRPLVNCTVDPNNAQCAASVLPTIAPIANRANTEGDTVTPADWTPPITVTDTTGTPLTFTTSALPPGLTFDPTTRTIVGTVSYQAVEAIGPAPLPVTVTVTNGRGFSSHSTFLWTIINKDAPVVLGAVSPSLTITTPHGIPVASPLSLGGPVTIQATDADPCDQTVFDWGPVAPIPNLQLTRIVPNDGSCDAGRVFTAVISGTPTGAGPGAFPRTSTFTVHAIDNRGSDVPVTFTWTLTNQPPVVANPNVTATHAGVPVAVTLTAQDPNGDAISSLVVAGLPHGLSAGPVSASGGGASVVISGAPDVVDAVGAMVTVTASDAYGASGTLSYRWPIVNAAPTITSPGAQLTKPNTPVTLPVSASDPDHDALTFTDVVNGVHTLPPGLLIDPLTGVIAGSPTTNGTFIVTIRVSDPFGASTAAAFNWLITTNRAPDCSTATGSPDMWPPNHKFQPVTIAGVRDPDGDRLTIRITSILQDEPTLVAGSGATAIDGTGVGTPTAQVRAERSGLYNGRLYFIGFSADDGKGGVCNGSVTVGVPHDEGQRDMPIDSGLRFNSTVPGVRRVR